MFKKILLRSVAGATALGSAVAISFAATPAVVTSAPEIRTVDCTEYPTRVSTTTQLSVRPAVAVYGTAAKATARVTSGAGTPTGRVRFALVNPDGSLRDAWTVGLNSQGAASVTFSRRLPAKRTYKVRARYYPGCSQYAGSSAGGYYTVVQAPTSTSVNAPSIRRGSYARVSVVVDSRSAFTPSGTVRIVIERRGNVVASRTRTLSDGRASARFGKYRPGLYTAEVTYLGTNNFRRSKGADDFRVRR